MDHAAHTSYGVEIKKAKYFCQWPNALKSIWPYVHVFCFSYFELWNIKLTLLPFIITFQ